MASRAFREPQCGTSATGNGDERGRSELLLNYLMGFLLNLFGEGEWLCKENWPYVLPKY